MIFLEGQEIPKKTWEKYLLLKRDAEWQAQIKEFTKSLAKHPLISKEAKKWGKLTMHDFVWQVSFYGFMSRPKQKKGTTLATASVK